MCPVGSIIESLRDGASSRHSLMSRRSVDVIRFVYFVLKHTNKFAIRRHVMNQIIIVIYAQMVGSAAGRS